MSFINSEVDVSLLPASENIELQAINRTYLKLLRIEWLITAFFLMGGLALLLVFVPELQHLWRWLPLTSGVVLLLLMYYALQQKSFARIAYALREHDVIYQKGWLVKSTKVCPFTRVQNCSIQSGPLERRWGLASLVLYTAGSEGADMRIPGLLQDEAESLRQFILSKINGTGKV